MFWVFKSEDDNERDVCEGLFLLLLDSSFSLANDTTGKDRVFNWF